jgi:phosphoribosyl 1,2-cyclic phosphodiesterase
LIVNTLKAEPSPSHFTFEETFNFLSQTTADKIYLVHLCHTKTHSEVQQIFDKMKENANLSKEIFVGFDGLIIECADPFVETK